MNNKLPVGFCYLQDPRMLYDIAYTGSNNFIGRPVAGYNKNVCIVTEVVRDALIKVQDSLDQLHKNYALKIFETIRPQRASDDLQRWAQDETDTRNKAKYYPNLSKRDLYAQGFILAKSKHSTGAAVDLTLVKRDANDPAKHTEFDMGTIFDFFGEESNTDNQSVSVDAQINRQMLKLVMERHGFKNYPLEWWHYNIVDEPFPDQYFDFVIE
jgi:D-alanyl-D-alanine dipeptidase